MEKGTGDVELVQNAYSLVFKTSSPNTRDVCLDSCWMASLQPSTLPSFLLMGGHLYKIFFHQNCYTFMKTSYLITIGRSRVMSNLFVCILQDVF